MRKIEILIAGNVEVNVAETIKMFDDFVLLCSCVVYEITNLNLGMDENLNSSRVLVKTTI